MLDEYTFGPCEDSVKSGNSESVKTAPKNNVQEGKSKMDLLPLDILAKYLCPAYAEGLEKYYRESWRGGFLTSTMISAALRHIEAFFYRGEDIDPDSETGKHHLAGAIFSLLSILHSLDHHPHLDDRRHHRTGELLKKQEG
ncbi:dATP/dGTP diphosphohydrolase domain-containing protein [Desulfobacter postgatei]|uniref:dATP/dGTP diphosphohydrolase domain-containing protein n=1 Tax=Desulfobacter postgatei TaxID=2293 RepID=UPI002FD8CF71